ARQQALHCKVAAVAGEIAYTFPPLTTVAQPKQAIGTGTAQLLLERIAGESGAPRRLILQPELRVRKSTKRYRPST
ncbi:substrate-binding domain-containing protein, partial [Niveibacterium sp.]|uniref:substrate-binding domain-containing protein n=1 Tax=Niveibacterium sp. TaxID=2017444 RepID=UPI0035B1022C